MATQQFSDSTLWASEFISKDYQEIFVPQGLPISRLAKRVSIPDENTKTYKDQRVVIGSNMSGDPSAYTIGETEQSTEFEHDITTDTVTLNHFAIHEKITREFKKFDDDAANKMERILDARSRLLAAVYQRDVVRTVANNTGVHGDSAKDIFTAGSADSGVSNTDNITLSDLQEAGEYLEFRAEQFSPLVFSRDGTTGTGTFPSFYLLCAPKVANQIQTDVSEFVPLYEAPGSATLGFNAPGVIECGFVPEANLRILSYRFMPFKANGSSNDHVFYSLALGKDAFKIVTSESPGFGDDGVINWSQTAHEYGMQTKGNENNQFFGDVGADAYWVPRIEDNNSLAVIHSGVTGESSGSQDTSFADNAIVR